MRLAGSLEDPNSAGSWTANGSRGANPSSLTPTVLFQLPPETKSTDRQKNTGHVRYLSKQSTVRSPHNGELFKIDTWQLTDDSVLSAWT